MSNEKSAVLRRLFWGALLAELAAYVWTFSANVGIAIFAILAIIACAGMVVAALISLRKPRYLPAVISLCLRLGLIVFIYGREYVYLPLELKYSSWQYWRNEAKNREHEAWRTELVELIISGKLSAAKEFVRAHEDLRFDYGKPFSSVLCPPDKKAPDLELLRLMGEHGAPTAGDLLVEAAKCSLQTVRAVMSLGLPATATSRDGRTALTKARDLDLLDFLVRQGVKVNARDARGATAVMYHRSAAVTRFLIAHGADVKAKDNGGRTALHYNGPREELASIYLALLEAGADPNVRDHYEGDTPLLAHRFDTDVVEVLISHGADWRDGRRTSVLYYLVKDNYFPMEALKWPGLNLAGRDGANLLLAALESQKFDMVQKLLDLGANPAARDAETGKSALEVVTREGWTNKTPLYRAMRYAAERFEAAKNENGDAGISDAGPP